MIGRSSSIISVYECKALPQGHLGICHRAIWALAHHPWSVVGSKRSFCDQNLPTLFQTDTSVVHCAIPSIAQCAIFPTFPPASILDESHKVPLFAFRSLHHAIRDH